MQEKLFDLMMAEQQKMELGKVLACNEKTEEFGLTLSEEKAGQLLLCRQETLKQQRRVEFAEGILPRLIEAFCDSSYLEQDEYAETLQHLQDIFYLYKNESGDHLTDDELMTFMREQFDGVCYGSVDYLADTCLECFTRAIRAGYRDFTVSGGRGEYVRVSGEANWDRDLFLEVLSELVC